MAAETPKSERWGRASASAWLQASPSNRARYLGDNRSPQSELARVGCFGERQHAMSGAALIERRPKLANVVHHVIEMVGLCDEPAPFRHRPGIHIAASRRHQ